MKAVEPLVKAFDALGGFAQRYPAILVGLLLAGTLVSALQGSAVPAIIQGACALSMAATIKR